MSGHSRMLRQKVWNTARSHEHTQSRKVARWFWPCSSAQNSLPPENEESRKEEWVRTFIHGALKTVTKHCSLNYR